MNNPRTPFEPDATKGGPAAPGSAFEVSRRRVIQLAGAAAGAAALTSTAPHAFGSPAPATSEASPTLATTFLGGNHTYDPEVIDVSGELGIGWGRLGVGWNRLQPRPDVPVDLDRPWFGVIPIRDTILRLRDAGLEPLIRLTNSPVWAIDTSHRTFEWNGVRWDYRQLDDGDIQRTATDPETGEVLQTRILRPGPTFPPAEIEDWKNFVDVVVSELVQPPYNVTYFQIGNEPIANAFFQGSKEEYVDKLLIPAAEVARPYGGKIVFGAMPAGQGISGLNEVLRYHDAWRAIDVLDAHYWPLEAMQWTWEEWVKPGKIPAFWQTELGSGLDDTTITSLFPRTLWWALEHGLSQSDPDKYKLFYYKVPEETRVPGVSDGEMGAALTYVDPDDGALKVSRHGRMLQTLHDLLDGDDLRSLHGVQLQGDIDPGDRGRPFSLSNHEQSVEGFRVGNRAVAAVHLPCAPNMWHSDYSRHEIVHLHRVELKTQHFVQVRFMRLRSQVVGAQAVDPEGNRFDVQWTNEGDGVVVSLDPGLVINADRGFARIRETIWTFYVELELDGRA